MKRKSRNLEQLQIAIKRRADNAPTQQARQYYLRLYGLSLDAESEYDDIIREAEMRGIRNPSFPDDLVGWLDDDFTYPDEEEDDENDKND